MIDYENRKSIPLDTVAASDPDPVVGLADRIEGRMNGLGCASKGEMCPTDRDDPHVLLERDFVVQTANGNYFYITNMTGEPS